MEIISRDWAYHVKVGSTPQYNNNNNQALILKFLGVTMDARQTTQGQPYVLISAILFYLKLYFMLFS